MSSVSVQVNAPYSAKKGIHLISFPTTDICGNSAGNQVFALVVYDSTPAITVSPTSIGLASPATLTITGSGFGDHPRVFVAGTSYNAGAPSRNAQGQDVVNVTVTIPTSYAGSTVPVYLQSNGAGGQAFFGMPLGTQQGSPQSNTVQLQVLGPTITSISPSSFQVGATSVQFTISGTAFGSGIPTLDFGSSGITNVVITGSSDTQVTGTLDVPASADAGSYTLVLTPAGTSQTAIASFQLEPAPPTISGTQGVWWLGPLAVNDNCNPNDPSTPSCYRNSTQLTVSPGPGGSAPSAGSPASWSIIPQSAQSYVALNCGNDPSCATVTVQLTSAPIGCGTFQVSASLQGISSAPYIVGYDQPVSVALISSPDPDNPWNIVVNGSVPPGYLSMDSLQLVSSCQQVMYNISVNETFASSGTCGGASAGWADLPAPYHFTTAPLGDPLVGQFTDTIGFAAFPGQDSPNPTIPGPRQNPPVPLSTQANGWVSQTFYVGSVTNGSGMPIVPDVQVRYIDHGRHASWTWTCPGQ